MGVRAVRNRQVGNDHSHRGTGRQRSDHNWECQQRISSDLPITRHAMLANRYYCGFVTFRGEEYEGRHEPLISVELFTKVKQVMRSHDTAGSGRDPTTTT